MSGRAYYNDNDPYVCAWLQNLMDAGEIAPGRIDDRDIRAIEPGAISDYEQVHLFAGIGGWPLALEWAGWGDRPVWTASCPCPPFSQAGKRRTCPECESGLLVWCPRRTGFAMCADCGHAWHADERHLWPEVWRLMAGCGPSVCFGEQVAGPAGLDWLAAVRASLEIVGFDFGCADLPASCVGAPHIRQRLFWVAHAEGKRPERHPQAGREAGDGPQRSGTNGGLAHPGHEGGEPRRSSIEPGSGTPAARTGPPSESGRRRHLGRLGEPDRARPRAGHEAAETARHGSAAVAAGGMGDASGAGRTERKRNGGVQRAAGRPPQGQAPVIRSPWDSAVYIPCADGKARPVEPGIQPVADGLPEAVDGLGPVSRIGALRGAGNAIVPEVAAAFIAAFMEAAA